MLAHVSETKGASAFMTQTMRDKVTKMKELLALGSSPFDGMADKGQLGGTISKFVRVEKDESEAIAKLQAKWTEKHSVSTLKPVILDDVDLGEVIIRDPEKLYCSYCHVEVDSSVATFGRGDLKFATYTEDILIHDELVIVEESVILSKKIVACPDCCLRIPAGKTKFPEMRG